LLKLAAALGGIALVGGAPIGAAFLLRPHPLAQTPKDPPALTSVAPQPGFPAPPRGAIVYSRQFGSDVLALGVVPRRGFVLLQASVLGPQGRGTWGLEIVFAVQRASARAIPCGPGCYRAALATTGRPGAVDVAVRRGSTTTHWHVVLPAVWPPPDASALVARAEQVWRSLRSLSFNEQLASDLRPPLESTWHVQAPDRAAYQVKHGWGGIIVGERRWDRRPGGTRWVPSPQMPISQPVPTWVSVVDAHVLGVGTVRGRAVWRVSFFDPGTPGWFAVAIERKTLRTLEVRMTATRHFMFDAYISFNTALPIRPPR
jgi:hypothetical protein